MLSLASIIQRVNDGKRLSSRPLSAGRDLESDPSPRLGWSYHHLSLLVLAVWTAGCALPSAKRARYAEWIRATQPAEAHAHWHGTSVVIRRELPGSDLIAYARWGNPEVSGVKPRYEAVALELVDRQDHAARRLIRDTAPMTIRSASEWRTLQTSLLESLTPTDPNRGLLVLVQDRETVLYRNAAREIVSVRLENLPAEVQVDRTLDSSDYPRRILDLVERHLTGLGIAEPRHVYATGRDPAYVLIDLEERATVFLSPPVNPEQLGLALTPAMSLRAAHSILLKSMALGFLKNPITSVSRGAIWFGGTGLGLIPWPAAPVATSADGQSHGETMDIEAWEAELDRQFPERRFQGSIEFLAGGEQFFPAFIDAIREATNRMDLQVYIFDNDDYAVRIADLIKAKTQQTRTRVLLDEFGTFTSGLGPPRSPMAPDFIPPASIQSYLRQDSRIHLRSTTNPWLTVNHKKIFVFDGCVAFLGGMNIGREYRYEWHDLMVRLTGPIVGRLQQDFDRDWSHASPLGDLAYAVTCLFDRVPTSPPEPGNIDIRLLYTRTGRPEIHRAQIQAIRRARQYIYIENPYFADDTYLRELAAARKRGVDVRVILPAENDSGIMGANNLVTANAMLKQGIRVYVYPGMTHVKAGVYDGWACLGSANFDKISLRVSQEINIAFSDPETVRRLNDTLFLADFSKSRELTEPLPVDWTDYLIEFFANEM